MAFKGTIFIHHNAKTKQLEVHASNHGPSPGVLTHNMRATEEEAYNEQGVAQHDDNGQFGHGNPMPAGTEQAPQIGTMNFPIGGTYKSEDLHRDGRRVPRPVPIAPGTFLRVGFRQRAFAVVKIPPPGEIVEIPYETMRSQVNSAMLRSQWASSYGAQPWQPEALVRDGRHVPPALQAMLAQRSPHQVKGQIRIVPVAADDNPARLKGWEVWFENGATGAPGAGETHGFTGTVVLTDRQGKGEKNAGFGLESMACPGGGTAARQFITADGDYGVLAQPGTPMRLGIRGYSSGNTTLPGLGDSERVIDLGTLTRTYAGTQSDWFDGTKLGPKLGEKKSRVDFFDNGERINDRLPDTIYTGAEAFERAEFKDPPKVVVRRVSGKKSGWEVTVESLLPDADRLGPVAFSARPKIDVDGKLIGARFLNEKKLTSDKRVGTWFIPADAQVGGAALKKGSSLVIDTGPLGWRGTIPLPGARETFDSSQPDAVLDTWVLRESDYHRAGLIP